MLRVPSFFVFVYQNEVESQETTYLRPADWNDDQTPNDEH
jgi:hypothetical protein